MVSLPLFLAVAVLVAMAAVALAIAPLRSAPRLFVPLVLLVAAATVPLYLVVGTPAALTAGEAGDQDAPRSIEEAVAQLEDVLRNDPAQPEGWALLARSYTAQGRFVDARDAFATAVKQLPDAPGLLVEAAQARAAAEPDKRFDDQALGMLRRSVELDPENQRGRWFIGVVQRQRGEHADAAATWEALLPMVDAATANALRQQIAEAREDAGLPPLPEAAAPAPAAGALRVRVTLDPAFAARARLDGDAAVFVIARIPGGPPMPVAVQRHRVRDLPLDILLDDGDSPMPTQTLSALDEVEVFARLSASGDATPGEGDLETAPVRVELPAAAPIELTLGPAPAEAGPAQPPPPL